MPLTSRVRARAEALPALAVDVVLAGAVTALSVRLSEVLPAADGGSRPGVWAWMAVVAAGVALAFRRRAPTSAFAVCVGASVAGAFSDVPGALVTVAPQLAYATVAARRGRRSATVAGLVLLPLVCCGAVRLWPGPAVEGCVLAAAWLVVVGLAGDCVGRLAAEKAAAARQASRIERNQREREQRAVLVDRIRIARELHDVTAHHLSVIAVQSSLARYVLTSDPDTAAASLRSISDVSSEGLDELRRLITLLRPDDEHDGAGRSDKPSPGIAQLPVLAERVGFSGVPIVYSVEGRKRPLPTGLELCVYRVAQESLTNVLKHAPGAETEVLLYFGEHAVSLRVTNAEGRRSDRRETVALAGSGGKGLAGMRERTALYGGTLTAGPRPAGGYEVVVCLPVRPKGRAGVTERGGDRIVR